MTFGRDPPPKWDFGFHGTAMNINYWWLEYIKNQIGIFMYYWQTAEFSDNIRLERMYEALEVLEALTSPKVDNDEVEKNLTWLQTNIPDAYRRNADGEIVSFRPSLIFSIKRTLLQTFKLMLIKMERSGLLTMPEQRPQEAMGRFQNT